MNRSRLVLAGAILLSPWLAAASAQRATKIAAPARPEAAYPFNGSAITSTGPGRGHDDGVVGAIGAGMQAAADELIADQCGNGGWNWPHGGCGTTFNNITPPIGLGILNAYAATADPDHLSAAVAGANYDLTSVYPNLTARFSSFGPAYFLTLSNVTGNPIWSNHAANNFFDALTAGTYGDPSAPPLPGDTADWISRVQAGRTGSAINLRPWDFQHLPSVAAAIGNPNSTTPFDGISQQQKFLEAVLDGLNTLDRTNPGGVYYDLLGLSGGVRGLALNGTTAFAPIASPNFTPINGISTLKLLADKLASYQNADGSWYWHSNLPTPTVSDEDTQSTAYAVLALIAADPLVTSDYSSAVLKGRDWLWSMQLPDGGFLSYPGGDQNIEVEAEALSALISDPCVDNKLAFEVAPASLCVQSGEPITVELWQRNLTQPVAGFQAWGQFDSTRITYSAGGSSYTSAPYGSHIINPIGVSGDTIDMTGGVTLFPIVQPPTTANAKLATLAFIAGGTEGPTTISFRYRDPPSRFTNSTGQQVLPCLVHSATILIDNTAPVITCPATAVVQCSENRFPATTGFATATDNLDDAPVVTYSDSSSGSCPMTVTRTWTATDCAGNSSSCVQTVTVDDTIPPAITCATPGSFNVPSDAGLCSAVVNLGTTIETFDNTPPLANTQAEGYWYVDRYAPAAFERGVLGLSSVLKHSISSADSFGNRPGAYQSVFYNTQGRKYDLDLAVGATLSVKLYIPSSWATDARRADLWATMFNSANAVSGFPIVGFTSDDPADPVNPNPITPTPRFRVWDDVLNVWVNLGLPPGFVYNDWYTLKIETTGTTYKYTVTGTSGSLTQTHTGRGPSVRIGNLILQAYNFGDATRPIGDSYDVYWDNCFLPAAATDNCIGPVVVTSARSDNPLLTLADPFPLGTTTVTWTATDGCLNTNTCSRTVTVNPVNNLLVNVDLGWPFNGSRCITFVLWSCSPLSSTTVSEQLNFVGGSAVNQLVSVPCGAYSCITATDTLHTLRRTAASLPIVGTQYTADFTTAAGKKLIGGNLNNDNVVDILDYGVFAYQWNVIYPGGGNTTCATPYPHADIALGTTPGRVDIEDFSFILTEFLKMSDSNCCGQSGIHGDDDDTPRTSISGSELIELGMPELLAGDLNGDGWLGVDDVVEFFMGDRPPEHPEFEPGSDEPTEPTGVIRHAPRP